MLPLDRGVTGKYRQQVLPVSNNNHADGQWQFSSPERIP
jgi:hypothetical protein